MKRLHPEIGTTKPIEFSGTAGEVLERCGIDIGTMNNINPTTLNSLPNLRIVAPKPRRHHTQWRFYPEGRFAALPSLESLLVEVGHVTRSQGITEGVQVWEGNDLVKFSAERWSGLVKSILEGSAVSSRVFNLPGNSVITEEESQEFDRFAAFVAEDIYQPSRERDIVQLPSDIIITPRLALSEVHHDSYPGISTVVGSFRNMDEPLKLWLIWPSTELHHLATCYGDTKMALRRMDHGSFFIQMHGDTIAVPANSPHAVISLNSCYLYGHSLNLDSVACDPPLVCAEMAAGASSYEACNTRIERLRRGLRHTEFRQAHIDQILQTWATEASIFRDPVNIRQYKRLMKVWCDDLQARNCCAWCISTNCDYHPIVQAARTPHIEAHLEGRTPSRQ
jgi:hypothetical protein